MITLSEYVADTLVARAAELATRWQERAIAATPRRLPGSVTERPGLGLVTTGSPPRPTGPDPAHAAESTVRALAASLTKDARPPGEVMRLGWTAGAAAQATGLSIHHVVRDADLLLAIVLAEAERALTERDGPLAATPADALAVARRLHRTVGRYTQAAVSGFLQSFLAALRERWRVLRHDLRNPLGTIRSALSLMEDESVPLETRQGPSIRAMVARNAGSLDRMIAAELDDVAAVALLASVQRVSLRDVALAARREVREAMRLAGCEVVVGDVPADPPAHVDAATLELALATLLLAAIARAAPGTTVRIDLVPPADSAPSPGAPPGGAPLLEAAPEGAAGDASPIIVRVTVEAAEPDGDGPDRPRWDAHGLALAAAVATERGGRLGKAPGANSGVVELTDVAVLYLELRGETRGRPRPPVHGRAGNVSRSLAGGG